MEEFYVKYRNLYVQRCGALCRGRGPCACRSEGCALPAPCLAAPVLLSQPRQWEAEKLLQPKCSVLAGTWATASPSLGFHMARRRLGVLQAVARSLLVCVVMGLGPKALWSCFVDFVFLHSSYLHCKWATLEELEKDPRISQKIKRFRNKQAQMKHIFTEVRVERDNQLCPTPALQGPVWG